MLVCVVSGLCHGVSTQVEFCFLFLGVRVSPSFPFLLLGLCVCVRVCFRKSCFVLPAALAWFRFAGPSLPPSLPPSLLPSFSPSLPPAPLFRGAGGRGFLGCHWCPLSPPTPPRAPAARPPASPWNVPPPPWNRVAGGGGGGGGAGGGGGGRRGGVGPAPHPSQWGGKRVGGGGAGGGRGSRLFRGSLQGRDLPAPLPSSAAGVASRRVARRRRLRAELGRLGGRRCGVPGGRRQRPVLGTFEPVVGSHLAAACILSLPLRSFGEPFRRVVTQPPGPRQSSQTPAMLAATVPVAPRPRDVLLSPEIGSLGF